MPKIHVQYFAVLREQRGLGEEVIDTPARTPAELYKELQTRHRLTLPIGTLRFAVNDEFAEMDRALSDGDSVVFLTPVAGG